jgi:hypothetical protein
MVVLSIILFRFAVFVPCERVDAYLVWNIGITKHEVPVFIGIDVRIGHANNTVSIFGPIFLHGQVNLLCIQLYFLTFWVLADGYFMLLDEVAGNFGLFFDVGGLAR